MEHFLTEMNQKVIQIESFYLESPSFRLALDHQITNFMIPKLMEILENHKLLMQMSSMQLTDAQKACKSVVYCVKARYNHVIYYTLLEKLRGLLEIVEVIDSDLQGTFNHEQVVLIPLLCFKD